MTSNGLTGLFGLKNSCGEFGRGCWPGHEDMTKEEEEGREEKEGERKSG